MTAARRVRLACQCGDTLTGTITPRLFQILLTSAWRHLHDGPGHGPATLDEARQARRRAGRALQRETTP